MSHPSFVYLDMSNPPTSYAGGVGGRFDYFEWFCKQLEGMRADSDVAVLTLIVPSKHLVDSGEVDLSSWPQLHQEYAAFPRDSPSSAEKMTPTFLRAVAHIVEHIREDPMYGQHASTQAQPRQTQNSSNVNTESAVDQLAQMGFGSAPDRQENIIGVADLPSNPAVPASSFFLAAQGPATPHRPSGLLTPTGPSRDPNSSPHTPQLLGPAYTPIPRPESSEQAGTPVNSATPLGYHQTGLLTPTGPPRDPNLSSHTPNYSPVVRPGQLPQGGPSPFETSRSATSHHSPAVSSTHYGRIMSADGVTGLGGPPPAFSSLNPFPRSAQTPIPSLASHQRSTSSASFQGQSSLAASMGSQGSGHSTRSSARIPGRRLMGGRGRSVGIQHSNGSAGGTDNSNGTGNGDLMDLGEPIHPGQGFGFH